MDFTRSMRTILYALTYLSISFVLIACTESSSIGDEPHTSGDATHTWTDIQGRTMRAELVEADLDKNEVAFLKDNGRRYRFPINQLSKADQEYVFAKKDTLPKPTKAIVGQRTDFEESIGKNLVQISNGRIKPVQSADLTPKDYYAVYYSAHWCPPCRKFTPKLVSFYNNYLSKNNNFEIIFVSSDRSEKDMTDYMEATKMPWLALEFGNRSHPVTKYAGNGIPCLVLLDNQGNVLADSYAHGRYVGPTAVMDALRKKLK